MYTYAILASLGDDVYHEPCTKVLEAHIAQLTGKEAAVFLPSGTMSNQIALRTHLKQPPYSVLVDVRAHINKSGPFLPLNAMIQFFFSGHKDTKQGELHSTQVPLASLYFPQIVSMSSSQRALVERNWQGIISLSRTSRKMSSWKRTFIRK
jgi:hypothetical protein